MIRGLILLLALCVPTAYLAWNARDMPQFGMLGDDTVYYVSAKALASGQGYRIPSLPGAPAQTKYPPLYPLLLSLVWKIDPRFPENLRVAALLAWLPLPILLLLARRFFTHLGLGTTHAWILCALMAVSAPVVTYSLNLMPELAFTAVLLACTMAADRETDARWVAAAGVLAGTAYLLKSAALPLLITSPVLYLLRKRYRAAVLFVLAMLPFVAGWTFWAHEHRAPPGDSNWLFYTDYIAYQFLNVPWGDLPLVLWTNLRTLATSLGALVAAPPWSGWPGSFPSAVVAAVALTGTLLLARRRGITHCHAFAVGLLGVLAVWHYPPVPRFVLPLMPLLLAGFSVLLVEAGRTLSRPRAPAWRACAFAALALSAALAPLAAAAVYGGPLLGSYRSASSYRVRRAAMESGYRWIAANTTPDLAFAASDDALLYLLTGRRAIALHIPPRLLYRRDLRGIEQEYSSVGDFARRNGLRYLLQTDWDFEQEFTPAMGRAAVAAALARSPEFRLVYRSPNAAVYEFRPEAAPVASP